jgi:4-amino-4-deoxy-L-arabinose transferase-like glycosyltransferase
VTAVAEADPRREASAERGRDLPVLAARGVFAVAAIKLLLQAAFLTPYGWHRDEFYYLVGGRHLDIGYVDHPLLVPWVARAVDALFGPSLPALRLVPALLGVATVVLTALLARELGGGRVAQVVAALCVALSPGLLAMNHWFQTPSFDVLAWVAASFALVRLLRTGDDRWWLGVGAAGAFGLLAKTTIVIWVLGLVVGLLVTPARRHLRSRWLLLGVVIAAVAAVPFVVFQLQHGWPFLEFTRNMNERTGGAEQPIFVPGQLILVGPAAAFVWVPGLWGLFRSEALARYRAFAWAYAIAFMLLLASAGKTYYLLPAYPVLLAAGAAYLEPRHWRRLPRGLVVGLVVQTLLVIPAVLPVLPLATARDTFWFGTHDDIAEQVGWPELVDTVRDVVDRQRGPTVVVTGNYGEAGALDVLGDLDVPIWSDQNSYWLWSEPETPPAATTFVTLGLAPADRARSFRTCATAARVDNGAEVDNEEQGMPVMVCHGLRRPWSETWSDLKHFD